MLAETGAKTGVFAGSLATRFGNDAGPAGDGALTTRAGDQLHFTYEGAADFAGTRRQVQATVPVVGGADGVLGLPQTLHAGETLSLMVSDNDGQANLNPGPGQRAR